MVRWALALLAAWILLNGLDDLFIDLIFCWQWLRVRLLLFDGIHWPSAAELAGWPESRIAIFVPLWREQDVIARMLEHNLSAVHYGRYEFFCGIYPNDAATLAAVRQVQAQHANVHVALCPHDGPTSKADCLNWIYQGMRRYEQAGSARFDIMVTHDAEDLIHPESLRLINYFVRNYDMVQVPVLALRTPALELTHGLYCDDFAEFQMKDLPVRQFLGGFIPSNGVGTGYTRAVLAQLAAAHDSRIFDAACLTEDYENGFRIHRLGCRQIFLPIHRVEGSLAATREFFPRTFRSALRQRTRWTMGLALQSWERHGWRVPARQFYWFWRDRKGLAGNLAAALTNLVFLYGAITWIPFLRHGRPWSPVPEAGAALSSVFVCTLGFALLHLSVRAGCVARIYGFGFALGVPLRAVWGNWLNCVATALAFWRYFATRWRRRPLVWLKTQHVYPGRCALMSYKRRLGEILVDSGTIDTELLDAALAVKPAPERLGHYLMRMGLLTETALYRALSRQQNLPLGLPDGLPIAPRIAHALPAAVARKWQVLPFRVSEGELYVASPELPEEAMTRDLRRFCRLELRFHLVTPTEFAELARKYLL